MKRPKPITPQGLENAALHYLERFAASADSLKRTLARKVERSARTLPPEEAEAVRGQGARLIEALIERYRSSGLLDDRKYAEGRARTLHRRGDSAAKIRNKLMAKGVAAGIAKDAVTELNEEGGDLAAAINFARRRRLGPFRDPAKRAAFKDKDLAALARAGFSYDIARKVAEAEDADGLTEAD